MTSNSTDTSNEILTSEEDRGNHNIHWPANPTLEQIQQMQVARKESSSGFMLLSVRHTSNIGSLSNGREMNSLVENYGENFVRSSSTQATSNPMIPKKPDMSRQFSSTMSLEAEEYDNNEEDDPDPHSEPDQFSHSQQQQQQFIMRNPPNLIPAGIVTMEPPVNGTQIVDGLRPLTASNLSQIQLSPGVVPIPAAVVQSPQQPPPAPIAAVPVIFHQINGHESTLIPVTSLDSLTQLQSAGILSGPIQGPRPSVQLTEVPPFKCSDPSAMPPAVIAITSVASMAGAAQTANLSQGQQRVSAVLNQPSIQHIIDQITVEPLRSVSDASLSNTLLTSLNAPIQPASRFRKARIHETVEQWSSKRISLHDCRLKAVPDWVTYLQSRPIDTTFNHPIAQRGRCLYCFVPGGSGSQCNKHDYNQNFSKFLVGAGSKHHHTRSPACSLPTVPETSEQSHIIQATFTAYRAATQRGYNLKNLLSTWDSGERSVNKALLEQFERSISPKSIHNPHVLKPNVSEPVLASFASTAIQHQHQHIETPSHSSTDVNVNAPIQGSEEFSNWGLTMVAQPTMTTQQHPSELVPLLEQPQAPPNGAPQTQNVSGTHVTDPSAAYLRRQITLCSEELETTSRSECVQQVQPPSTLSVAMSDQRSIFPPPTSPAQAALLLGGNEQISGVAPEVSPRSVRSFSGTTIGSVQLSPDTEMSGGIDSGIVVAIPQASVPSTAGSHNLTNIISSSLDHILPDGGISMITIPQTQAKQQQPPNSAVPMVTAAPAATATTEFIRNITPSVISNLRAATGSHLASATSLDFSAASRNICEAVEAVANAYAPALANGQMNTSSPSSMQISLSSPPLSQPPHSAMASNSPSSNNNTNATTTSVSENLQAPVPKCMDVIRGAIMETLQDHYAQLSSEIEALRTTVNTLQQENTQLRTYKKAFDNLCPYLTPETWEQINQQVRAAEVTEGNQTAVAAPATAQESIAYQPQPQTQHFFPSSNAAATVAIVQQQLNSAFQAQQQQPVNLSPSHISLQPPPPQNSNKTDPQ